MAEFRNIHTRIWKDEWFCELPGEAKLLFIYLFSNERASVCGMYELPFKFIVFETGLNKDRVSEILDGFEKAGKAYYRNGIVWVVNLRKYNDSGDSIKVRIRMDKDLAAIPDCELKRMYYTHYKIPYPQNGNTLSGKETRDGEETDTETETETENAPLPDETPELALYREVTGLVPDFSHVEEVKRNVRAIQERKHIPIDMVRELMKTKFAEWCESRTPEGKPYNPSNPKWLEWCVTGYSPKPEKPANGKRPGLRGI